MRHNFYELEKQIGITFHNKEILKNALIHRSYLNENKESKLSSNEKLEFLGDSILSLITSLYLYKKYPHLHEGDYTDIKASIVKTESLSEAAEKLKLSQYIFLSKGEQKNMSKTNSSILADCFEAIIAATFLDHNFEAANSFVLSFLFCDKLDHIVKHKLYLSPKNRLQEYWQNKYKALPQYRVIHQTGPEHKKQYVIAVFLHGKKQGEGKGNSKKEGEENAALHALQKLTI